MTGLLGADVDALEDLSRRAGDGAQVLRTVAGDLTAQLGTVVWQGRDAEAFRVHWEAQLRPGLDHVAARLGELGSVLTAQAQEQRETSSAGAAGVGTAGAGAAGVLGAAAAAAQQRAVAATATPPPAHGSPKANAGWWKSLSPAQQAAYAAVHPGVVGSMDGVPAHVRSTANQANLPLLRTGLQAELAAQRAAVAATPWLPPTRAELNAVRDTQGKLDALDTVSATMQHGDRQLLLLDTSGDQAKAVVAVGDVDTADHVAVFTPGLTTTVQGSLEGYDDRMAHLRAEAEAASVRYGDGGSVATVSWLGYRAPLITPADLLGSRSVLSDGLARTGAASLAPFLNGLDASRATPPHLTALGHSYGSLTTALALQQGTGVDDAVVFGSPGLGTNRVGELNLPAGHAYYVESAWDPVADTAHFGVDPSWMPGLTGLSAEAGTASDGTPLTASTGHGTAGTHGYLTSGSTSAHNMAAVVAGVPQQVITGTGRGAGDVLSWPVPGTYR